MKIRYDEQVDALYIHLTDAAVADTREQAEGLIFDYDSTGEIVGIEILQASSKRINPRKLEFEAA